MMLATACGGDGAAPTSTRAPAATVPPTATTAPTVAPTSATPEVVLELASAGELLEFDTNSLTAAAGAEVVLRYTNTSTTQQHNWVMVQAGTKDDVATAGTLAGPGDGWIPLGMSG